MRSVLWRVCPRVYPSTKFGEICERGETTECLRLISTRLVRCRLNPERPGDLKECFDVTMAALHDDSVRNIRGFSLILEF